MRLAALSLLALAALAACTSPILPPLDASGTREEPAQRVLTARPRIAGDPAIPVIEATAAGDERAFASSVLADLQRRSFAQNREFCGYLGLDENDRWITTPISVGAEASCPLPVVPPGMRLAASFHTHGTYSPHYASEWPTTQDILTDRASGIDGYIATPGGRLWHVDTDAMEVTELCGRGCLPQDPNYIAAEDGPLLPLMTFGHIMAWERSMGGPF